MIKVSAYKNNIGENTLKYMHPMGLGAIKQIADPYVSGYSFIMFLFVPKQIRSITTSERVLDTMDTLSETKSVSSDFFDLMEKTFKSVSGIGDITLETAQMTGGFTGIEHHFPTVATKDTTEITLTFQAMSGNIYRAPIQHWVTGISDIETGLRSLPTSGGIAGYSVEMLYVNTNSYVGVKESQTRIDSLEFAAFFDGMFPKSVPLDRFNYESNAHDVSDITIPFACEMHMGPNIDDMAKKIIGSTYFYNKYILPGKKYIANRSNNADVTLGSGADELKLFDQANDETYIIKDEGADL